jgi:hypothetical protein
VLFAVTVLLLCGVPPSAAARADVVTDRGLQQTPRDQDVVAKAVERANRLLVSSEVRLAPAWGVSKDKATATKAVPVYLVQPRPDKTSTIAAVPAGCRCVFVDPELLSTWVANNSRGTGRLKLDRGYFLTFILLHEAGHIAAGTPAAAFDRGGLSQLNIDPSRAKANEEDADEFAASLLRRVATQTPASADSLEANLVVNELFKLSWNMQAFRTLDEFGAFAVGKPGVFFDAGYSHPNLAWRILRSNYLIQPSDATRQLLEAFDEARQRGASSRPLFEAQPR